MPTLPLATAQPGGVNTITLPLPSDTERIHPLLASSRDLMGVCSILFESLVAWDEGGAPAASLASGWETDDGQTWTFTLRQNVVWHDGRPLDAEDVVFTLNLIQDMGENAYYSYIFDVIDTFENAGGAVRITTKTPYWGLLHVMTFPVLPRHAGYTETDAPSLPIGTGPYYAETFTPNTLLELRANTSWWRQPAEVEHVRAIAMDDTEGAISALVYSQVDAVLASKTTVRQYSAVGASYNLEYATRQLEFLVFNQRASGSALSDVRIRQAIAYAINKADMISYIYDNHAIAVDSPIPPDSWLYSGRTLVYEQNMDRARSLMAQSGWQDRDGDGIWDLSPEGRDAPMELKILVNSAEDNTFRREAAALIQSALLEIGIHVEMDVKPWEDYITALEGGDFDLALCGTYLSPIPDYSVLVGTEGALNYGRFSSSSMDEALTRALSQADKNDLQAAVEQVHALFISEMPIVCLYFRTHTLMAVPELQGISNVREESGFSSIGRWYFAE